MNGPSPPPLSAISAKEHEASRTEEAGAAAAQLISFRRTQHHFGRRHHSVGQNAELFLAQAGSDGSYIS